ncbi:PAS domain-containing protein [Myxococcota bacterium]|nr:PAS domain-containing protein [Myxococcota bacterium]
MSWLRIASLLVLVAATAFFAGGAGGSLLEVVRGTLMRVALVWLVPAAIWFPILMVIRSHRGLVVVALAQSVQDALLSAVLVATTGGTGSAFTFFFSLNIIVAGILARRMGTWFAIGLSAILMGLIASLELGLVGIPAFLGEVLALGSASSVLFSLALNLVAFVSIGVLSGFLLTQMQRADLQRERYRTSLEDLRQLHESILASLNNGVITCRLDYRVLHINRSAEQLLGLDMRNSRGRVLFDLVPDMQPLVERGPGPFDFRCVSADGTERWLQIGVSPLMDRMGEPIGRILDFADVTHVRRLEEQRKAEERLAVIGKLAAVVAHEIRNPLAAISASAQMIQASLGHGGEEQRPLEIMIREIDRLNEWITELLDYARPRTGEWTEVDLGDLLSEVLEVVRGMPRADLHRIRADLEPGLVLAGDRHRLYRIFLNLCKNAVEALDRPGEIEVWMRADREGDPPAAVVRVIDNGPGIPPDDLPRVFDAFFTTKARGTGLGLAIVKQACQEHRGDVTVRSVPGLRTEFEVRLPLA